MLYRQSHKPALPTMTSNDQSGYRAGFNWEISAHRVLEGSDD